MANYTVFISYILIPSNTATKGYGNSQAIHCNYINQLSMVSSNINIEKIRVNFPSTSINDFKFLSGDIANGTGFTANKLYVLIQTGLTTSNIKPDATKWKIVDVTSQITTHTTGTLLTPTQITSVVFEIPLNIYSTYSAYNILDFIKYPSKQTTDDDKLCFGDEIYFFGNVTTQIHADVFTTDLSITLPLNEYNSSTNATWTNEKVSITEIGIYDDSTPKNLVAIGKLNNPIEKDSTIARTIFFAIDF